jgi:hypothetical protein
VTVQICGAAAVSDHGSGWRGLGVALTSGAPLPGIPDEPLANPQARRAAKMMSRGAHLAAHCLHALVGDAGWQACSDVGYFLGVGASGGSLADLTAMLDATFDATLAPEFTLARFGEAGLAACNPLLAFQLMNNFTLCHGAIVEGIGGPNSALFSRGAGTTAALIEAVHAIREGTCTRAIAGGADSAIHPVTRAELARDGFVARGLVPGEGAALVALTAGPGACTVLGAAIASGQGRPFGEAIDEAVAGLAVEAVDTIVVVPWGPPAADALRSWASRLPGATILDVSRGLGDALAASPALGWVAALDLIVAGRARRALVVAAGTDGDVGAVLLGAAA